MMSIFIARHLISIIAQIANDEGKGEGKKKNCIKSPVLQCFRKEGGSARMVRKKNLVHWQLFGWGHIIFG